MLFQFVVFYITVFRQVRRIACTDQQTGVEAGGADRKPHHRVEPNR